MKPLIAVIHNNALCRIAAKMLISGFTPFEKMHGRIDVRSYGSLEEFLKSGDSAHVVHFFVSDRIVRSGREYFDSHRKQCVVLAEDEAFDLEGYHRICTGCPDKELLDAFLMMHHDGHRRHGLMQKGTESGGQSLTEREKQILALVIKGHLNKEIAGILDISVPTVAFHRRNIAAKLGTKSIGIFTIHAILDGIVSVNDL